MRILFWFRRDLRLDDNTGLSEAVRDAAGDVVPFYASEPAILESPDTARARIGFVLDSLADLERALAAAGSRLVLDHGEPISTVIEAARRARADAVYWNEVQEPRMRADDDRVDAALAAAGVGVKRFEDRLLVPPGAVLNASGEPYVVFTPFRTACERLPLSKPLPAVTRLSPHAVEGRRLASRARLGVDTSPTSWPGGASAAWKRLAGFVARKLAGYASDRDLLGADGTSRLSADLVFGTISPRTVAHAALAAARRRPGLASHARKLIEELRWRDFYSHILHHFPHVERAAFRKQYERLEWEGDRSLLDAWREGRTGHPIVDAGMRQLLGEGFMHNRARMIVASFLTKDLLLDWRLGERHFMRHLVDGDLANNNGGWQWAASTGTDPQPWFRVFNPVLQGERFDPRGDYVRRWVPELARVPERWIHRPWEAPVPELERAGVRLDRDYPRPVVDHAERRELALEMYRRAGA